MNTPLECTGCANVWEADVPEQAGDHEFKCPRCGRTKRIRMMSKDTKLKSEGEYSIRPVLNAEDEE